MNTLLLIYFLKANLALAILYISYRMLFQRDTFFTLRRLTLLSIILVAFLYQLPDISSWLSTRTRVTEVLTYYTSIVPVEISAHTSEQATQIDWKENLLNISLGIYLAGVVLLFVRCLIELFAIVRAYLTGRKVRIGQTRVCLLPEAEKPYSFFGWIFLPEDKYREDGGKIILAHELRHSQQWHSLDVLLSEAVCILCWINPFACVYEETPIAPEYPGGYKALISYIENTMIYPKEAQDKKEEGRVTIQFIIDKEGNPTNFEVEKPLTPLLDAEAMRVAKSIAKWKPGRLDNGKAVRVRMHMPLVFRLQ